MAIRRAAFAVDPPDTDIRTRNLKFLIITPTICVHTAYIYKFLCANFWFYKKYISLQEMNSVKR
jgi:hypothetical protein